MTFGLFLGLAVILGFSKRAEVMANWANYRSDPKYVFTAFLYKPDNDQRSRLQFTADNFSEYVGSVILDLFAVFTRPLFDIFRILTSSLENTLGAFVGMRNIIGNMYKGLLQMVNVFMNRFTFTTHKLRLTMYRLLMTFKRAAAVATNAVFMGLSSLYAALNMIDLIIKIAIIILVILVILTIFFFWLLAPVIPIILVVVAIIATTAFAGSVGGMASTFCFDPQTPIAKQDQSSVPISEIKIGDILADGGKVTGVLEFQTDGREAMFEIAGIQVSGSHIYFSGAGNPCLVQDASNATPIEWTGSKVFCLLTTSRKIPIRSPVTDEIHLFADWEELSDGDIQGLQTWNQMVFETLNPGITPIHATEACLKSESAVAGDHCVLEPNSEVGIPIRDIRPGMVVLDAYGNPTKVTGVVQMSAETVGQTSPVAGISAGAWIHSATGVWNQEEGEGFVQSSEPMYQLFTEAGSFAIRYVGGIRDFSDIGVDRLESTYASVLSILSGNAN